MSAHTPGPWRVSPYGDVEAAAADRGDGALLAAVRFMGNGEERANANLIAAAPDLLAALVKALEAIERGQHRGPLDGLEMEALRVGRAAIARAEGSTK